MKYGLFQDISGQVVLITGGAGGVGAHLARNFGKLNAKIVIWDVNSDGKWNFASLNFYRKLIYISTYIFYQLKIIRNQ